MQPILTKRLIFIVNPVSGGGRALRLAKRVVQWLRSEGASVEVRSTTGPGDAAAIASEVLSQPREDVHGLVACGGDGTVQQVANVLADTCASGDPAVPAMGILPCGRCNDFARAMGIPRDAEGAARILLNGIPESIDLGQVNRRFFCTVATVGVDAEISSFVDRMRMPLRGTLAYLYGTARVLPAYRPPTFRIEGDFGGIDGPLFVASAANTPCYGGAIRIAPRACPRDGRLDLCVIRAVSKRRILTLLPKVVAGRHESEPEVRLVQARRFAVTAERTLQIWADGERLTETPAEVAVVPGAIRVFVPTAGLAPLR